MELEHLLDDFPPVTTQAWEDAIRQDLKGADYGKKMIWQSPEGIEVKPYYRQEDVLGLAVDRASAIIPNPRPARVTCDWRIREEIVAVEPSQANLDAQKAVGAGADEISFRRVEVKNASDLRLTMMGLESVGLNFENGDPSLIGLLCERVKNTPDHSLISTGMNPLADPEFAAATIATLSGGFLPFTIPCERFEAQGANSVHELAFALAAGIEYLAAMDERHISADRAAAATGFSFSIGASYFFQIAKFRAFRLLWSRAVESFGGLPGNAPTRIFARTSVWDKTVYDPHVNVLRATTEGMSAILGGVDSLCIAPFDECYKLPDEASQRLARNTQLMLKHEARLAHVADPGAGAYYLESITDSLAEHAWNLMQRIEASGGYRKATLAGSLDELLFEAREVREKSVVTRRRVFTGTNQYADVSDKALGRIDIACTEAELRGALPYEQLRLRTERFAVETGKTPRVLLAEFGDARMRTARSNFAVNFFACAGFETQVQPFDSPDAPVNVDTDLIVLCSADSEYLQLAKSIVAALRKRGCEIPVLVAGYPETVEQLREVGVADFIHVRSNPIEVLTHWQQQLGVRL